MIATAAYYSIVIPQHFWLYVGLLFGAIAFSIMANKLGHRAIRPRIYDRQKDHRTAEDFPSLPDERREQLKDAGRAMGDKATTAAMTSLYRAMEERPERVLELLPEERRSRDELGYSPQGNVIPLPLRKKNTRPAA